MRKGLFLFSILSVSIILYQYENYLKQFEYNTVQRKVKKIPVYLFRERPAAAGKKEKENKQTKKERPHGKGIKEIDRSEGGEKKRKEKKKQCSPTSGRRSLRRTGDQGIIMTLHRPTAEDRHS